MLLDIIINLELFNLWLEMIDLTYKSHSYCQKIINCILKKVRRVFNCSTKLKSFQKILFPLKIIFLISNIVYDYNVCNILVWSAYM